MLVRLFGSNFRSLKGPFELSMVAADWSQDGGDDRGVIPVSLAGWNEPLRLLRTVAIYGPNGSGKLTVLKAASALRWIVTQSLSALGPGDAIPMHRPFADRSKPPDAPVTFGCDVAADDRLLRYEITFRPSRIDGESLTALDASGPKNLTDRKRSVVRGTLIERSKANTLYVKAMQPNVSVLCKLAQLGTAKGRESVVPYQRVVARAVKHKDYSAALANVAAVRDPHRERFADDPAYRDWIMDHLIRTADVGISGVNVGRRALSLPVDLRRFLKASGSSAKLPSQEVVITFRHGVSGRFVVDFQDESAGTQKLFNLSSDWWALAHASRTLFADELGAGIHPRLLDRLIRAVNDRPADAKPSQLVFATHDIGLLESIDGRPPALRSDQVYLTQKDQAGATELYALEAFGDRSDPDRNIRKRYNSGVYGAIPLVERLSL